MTLVRRRRSRHVRQGSPLPQPRINHRGWRGRTMSARTVRGPRVSIEPDHTAGSSLLQTLPTCSSEGHHQVGLTPETAACAALEQCERHAHVAAFGIRNTYCLKCTRQGGARYTVAESSPAVSGMYPGWACSGSMVNVASIRIDVLSIGHWRSSSRHTGDHDCAALAY